MGQPVEVQVLSPAQQLLELGEELVDAFRPGTVGGRSVGFHNFEGVFAVVILKEDFFELGSDAPNGLLEAIKTGDLVAVNSPAPAVV